MKDASAWPTDAIERILQTYGDTLYRICLILLKNDSDAQDVLQETIIRYYWSLWPSASHYLPPLWRPPVCMDSFRTSPMPGALSSAHLTKMPAMKSLWISPWTETPSPHWYALPIRRHRLLRQKHWGSPHTRSLTAKGL